MNYGRERRIPDVKKLSMKNYVFAVGIAGFLAGSVCVNLWMKEYIWDIGIFHEFFLEQYQQMDIRTEAYLWYLIKVRSIPLVILAAVSGTRYKKAAVLLSILWAGFCAGMVLCTAIARLQLKGIVLCLVALVPHGLLYAAGYLLLFRYMLGYPLARWQIQKTVKLVLIMSVGMLMEYYVNPVIVHMFLKSL